MGVIDKTQISTGEYGLISAKDICQYNLPSTVLCYDTDKKQVNFFPLKKIQKESRKSVYIVTTFKKTRVFASPDQLFYSDNTWKIPAELKVGDEVWTNLAKTIVTDMITEIRLIQKPTIVYTLDLDYPYFANKILIKEP